MMKCKTSAPQILSSRYNKLVTCTMDDDVPVNIRTLGETMFNPELSDELNLNFGFHYSATSTLMQHVLREMDGRTLFRLYAMRMGLFGEASLAEMLEEQRRDVCPVCLCDDFEVLSEVLIMPCCGTRYHTYCINPYSRCPTCRCNRPTIGWVGFQTWVSYFTWLDWRGRIDQILQNDPVRAIVPLIRALHGTHSDNLKSDAVTELLKLVPQYSVHMEEAGIRKTLLDLIYDDNLLNLGRAAKNSIIYELHEETIELFGRLREIQQDKMPGSSFAWIRPMLEGDNSSHIIVALKILRRIEPAAFVPFADYTVSLLKHRHPRVREDALSLFEAWSEIAATEEHIPLLGAMLSTGGTDEVKQMAARAICALIINADDDDDRLRLVIVHAGAIPPLVAMLSAGGTADVKEVAARALCMLSNGYNQDTRVCVAIVQAVAIPPLVAMLSVGGADNGKEAAATVLYNLSISFRISHAEFQVDDVNVMAIAQAGAIPPLVMMLSAPTHDIKICAARLLGNLSSNNDYKVEVALAGAIPHLISMLCVGETTSSACTALWRISTSNNNNKVAIAQAGAIPHLVEIISYGNYGNTKAALHVLGELATNDENKVTIALAGAIPPLVALLSSRFHNVIPAMKALKNLWSNNDNKMAIARAGAISRFAKIRNSTYYENDVREAAAEAIRILSDSDE